MGVKLQSALGGSVELNAPSTASNFTMTVPAGNGTVATTDQLMGFRNRVINGAMRVNQRNGYSAFTVGTNSTIWVSDRFSAFSSGGQTFGINSAGLPSGSGFNYGLELKPQSGATSVQVNHKIESSNVEDLAGQTVTLSFWIYTTGLSGTSSYVQPYTPTAIDNYSSTVYGTAQNISYTNGQWVKNVFTFNTTNSSMNANNGLAILWNFVNAVGATIWITGVQLERGSIATAFEHRPYQTELALCQRYYVETTPFSFSFDYPMNGGGYWAGNSYRPVKWFALPVQMRVDPSTTVSYSSSGWTAAETTGASSTQGSWGNRTVYWMVPPYSTGGGNPYVYGISWKCSAEL